MKATITSARLELATDQDPDLSYLTQDHLGEEGPDRLSFYGDTWEMVSIRARAAISFASGAGAHSYSIDGTDVVTPGLYGIESDSGSDYFDSIGYEELHELGAMLRALGFTPDAIHAAFANGNVEKDWS